MKKVLKEKKIILPILLIQLFILIAETPFLFLNNYSFHLDSSDFSGGESYFDSSKNATVVESEYPQTVDSKEFSLPRGVYRIYFNYKTTDDQRHNVLIKTNVTDYAPIKTNSVTLYREKNSMDYLFYVNKKTDNILISLNYDGGEKAYFEIDSVDIVRTNIYSRITIFTSILAIIICDFFLLLALSGWFTQKRKLTFALLFGCAILSSAPLLTDYVTTSGDYIYHLLRIEGVKDGILSGYFPIRIYPNWVFGYGYIDAAMYGNILLYIPAVFRIVGFSVTASFKALVISGNLIAIATSYLCFKKMFKDNVYAGVLGTYLYTLMPYRMMCIHDFGNVGFFCASSFMPLILLGLYKIFTDDVNDKKYKYNFLIATAGICGVFLNHILSTEIIAVFIILICLILIKRVFVFKRFLQLLATLVSSLAISIYFIIPFLDNLRQNLQIKNVSARTIQEMGIFPTQFLSLFVNHGSHTFYGPQGMTDCYDSTSGFALTFGLFVFLIILFTKEKGKRKTVQVGIFFAVLAVLAGYMCTLFFPWDFLQSLNGLFETMISSLQFPTRLIMITGVFLIVVTLCAYAYLTEDENKKKFAKIFWSVEMGLVVIATLYLNNDLMVKGPVLRIYDMCEVGTGNVAGGEYLFYGLKDDYIRLFTYRNESASENVTVNEYKKDGLKCNVTCTNTSAEEGYIELPLLYYIGYKAYDTNTGETMTCIYGNRCDIRVLIPSGYNSSFEVKYTGRGYWKLGDMASAGSLILLCVWFIICKKKDRAAQKPELQKSKKK